MSALDKYSLAMAGYIRATFWLGASLGALALYALFAALAVLS